MDYLIRTILYATDLGPHGAEVFNHAFSLAKQYSAKIHVVHALEPMSDYAQSMVEVFVPSDTLKARRQEGLEQAKEEMRRRLENSARIASILRLKP